MRNSLKSTLLSAILLVVGISSVTYFISEVGRQFMHENLLGSLVGLAVIFTLVGYYHGAARGWSDIELRREYPEHFKNENVSDD